MINEEPFMKIGMCVGFAVTKWNDGIKGEGKNRTSIEMNK